MIWGCLFVLFIYLFLFIYFFGCFCGFLQIKVNLVRSNLPFFSFYSDLISLFWLKSKLATWCSSTEAAKVDCSLLWLLLKLTPTMTTPCYSAKSDKNLRIQTSFTQKHKSKTMKLLQSKQTKTVQREIASLLIRWLREKERAMAKLLNLTSATAQIELAKRWWSWES